MEEIRKEMMELGLRITPQRIAILEYLRNNRIHPSAEKVRSALLEKYPGLSLTTVYSVLTTLAEKHKIKKLDIDPHKTRFDSNPEPHDHFYCRICGNVYDIGNSISAQANDSPRNGESGHNVETVMVNLLGVCGLCGERNL